jgi:hypothetical protein
MPLFAPKDLGPADRLIYRRWVGGLFATYGALTMILCSVIFYQTVVSPRQPQPSGLTADAETIDAIGPLPVRHAVKHD